MKKCMFFLLKITDYSTILKKRIAKMKNKFPSFKCLLKETTYFYNYKEISQTLKKLFILCENKNL